MEALPVIDDLQQFEQSRHPHWICDPATLRILAVNQAACTFYGYTREQLLRMGMRDLEVHGSRTDVGPMRVEARHRTSDGSIVDVEVASAPTSFRGSPARLDAITDVSQRMKAERSLDAQLAVTRALGDAEAISDAAPMILEALGRHLEWDSTTLWKSDGASGTIRCLHLWTSDNDISHFPEATLNLILKKGQGIPGRVWETGDATWVMELARDPGFARLESAVADGLEGAFAFPVQLGAETGVLEFFTRRRRMPDESVIRLTAAVASQIAQFYVRQQSRKAMIESEARKTAIMAAALDAIVSVDHELRVIEFNPAAEEMFGFRKEEILGKPAIDKLIQKEFIPMLKQAHESYMRTGVSQMLDRRVELLAKKADGSMFPIEFWATQVEGHEHPYFTAYIHDISERKRRESEIKASEARYRGLMEQASDGILVIDATGRFVDCNARLCEMTGYPREELLSFQLADVLPADILEQMPAFLQDARTGHPRLFERNLKRKNGERYPVETSVGMTQDGNILAIVRDVTDRKAAESEIRETVERLRKMDAERLRLLSSLVNAQEEERRRIAGDIHDDSIQVMIALAMRLEAIERSVESEELRENISGIRSHAEHAVNRLRLLLFDLHPPNLESEGVVPALRSLLEQLPPEHGTVYTMTDRLVSKPRGNVSVLLYRIGQELITNIRKHARATTVAVSLSECEGGYLAVFEDNGVGFSTDDAHLYQPGHLGMLAMKERVEMAGGWLKIRSAPGQGSKISFWLPYEYHPESAAEVVDLESSPKSIELGEAGEERPSEVRVSPID